MKILTFTILVLGILTAATVKNASLSTEPVSMIALGAVLIGLAEFGRRIFIKKS
jgi:hypothetical protein